MMAIDLDKKSGIAIIRPESALSEGDFKKAAEVIDPYVQEKGRIKGLIIYTESFPGWETFAAMMEHFKFVRDHHKKIDRVALVTDSKVGDFAERVATHFVSAEINTFAFNELDRAKSWAASAS
jgi:hypothetical protein